MVSTSDFLYPKHRYYGELTYSPTVADGDSNSWFPEVGLLYQASLL